MIRTVECSSCSTSFPVDTRKVPADGVYARCSACSTVFFVEGGEPAAAAVAASAHVGEGGGFEPSGERGDLGSAAATAAPPAPPETGLGDSAEAGWVFEREPEIDATTLDIERLDTVEDGLRPPTTEFSVPAATTSLPELEPVWAPPEPPPAPAPEPVRADPPPPPPSPAAPAPTAPRTAGFTFGRRDPHEKASRLARVLVSDIITYNPERHQRALDAGTLNADFDDEIKKSWGEYVDQVGKELAESTDYFRKALNEILARGQQIF